MNIFKKVNTTLSNGEKKIILFGHPEGKKELIEMFKFRNDVYVKKNYIDKNFYSNGLDCDEYDKSKKCIYFIAKIENKLIGSARLIKDKYSPTEKHCFNFIEPREIIFIPRNERAEIGRLIIIRYSNNIFLPRHIIMLGILTNIINYCATNGIRGGYSFIKNEFKKKLNAINAPIHIINNFKQTYKGKLLHRYFNNSKDPVFPIYYLTSEISDYLGLMNKINITK